MLPRVVHDYINGISSTHFVEQPQDNNLIIEFHALLKKKLFSKRLQSANSKLELERFVKYKDVDYCCHDKFIHFGNKSSTSFIIIDIDKSPYSFNQFLKHYNKVMENYQASWILQSNSGYHIAFMLKENIYYNNSNDLEKLNRANRLLTLLFNGDNIASLRKYGFYRNPLEHKSLINTKTHDIDVLLKHLERMTQSCFSLFDDKLESKVKKTGKQKKQKNKTILNNSWSKIEKKGFKKGNRNQFLFATVTSLLYNRQIKEDEVLATLLELNSNELCYTEVERICKSILKYKLRAKPKSSKIINPYVKGEYWEDMKVYQIHNFKSKNKTEFQRQKLGQKIRTLKVVHKTIGSLVEGYFNIYKSKSNKFTNENIERNSTVSKRTIQRFRNKRKIEDSLKAAALKLYMISLCKNTLGGSDKAKVIPIEFFQDLVRKLANKALKKIDFMDKKTGVFYKFVFGENNRLNFLPL